MKYFHLLILVSLLLGGCAKGEASTTAVPDKAGPSIVLSDCRLSAQGMAARSNARCGTLSVPENRSDPTGRQIELNLAVVPAVSRNPAPDPLFFLTGGPGQAATESYLNIAPAFERVRQKRDIVLVDQRGTGKSNPLSCPEPEDPKAYEDDPQQAARECVKAIDADLTQYTTPIAMQDLDAVRAALGYEQINLYGVSYGTRAAQTYMKMFPERVRAVVLDGVVPQSEPLGLYVAQDAQQALDLIFARCLADLACSQAFPDVEQDFEALVQKLKQDPVEVSLADPLGGEPTTLMLSDAELATTVRLLSYTPETAALLPLLIHQASAEGDYSRLAAQYLILAGQLSESISVGMNLAVLCTEDQPFIDPAQAEQLNRGTYMGDLQTDQLAETCKILPKGEIPPDFKQPVVSDLPVLLLSGEVDPVTPPSNAEEIAGQLSYSLSLVVPGQGHNVVFRGCIPWLVGDFMESASFEGLDAACIQQIGPMPFFLNYSGPVAQEAK